MNLNELERGQRVSVDDRLLNPLAETGQISGVQNGKVLVELYDGDLIACDPEKVRLLP